MILSKNLKVLDVACGIAVFPNHISPLVHSVIGFDISIQNIVIANNLRCSNSFFYVGNAEHIPHPDNFFDMLISICALEHFRDHELALSEMHRVLKPGGRLVMTVDSMSSINDQSFIDSHKKLCYVNTYFTKQSISEELNNTGFELEKISTLMSGRLNAFLCKISFKLIKHPYPFHIFSLLIYPLSKIFHYFNNDKKNGIIIGIVAKKTKADLK